MITRLNPGTYYELILDTLPMLVFFKDRENRFLYANEYVAKAYKRTKSELINKSLYDIYDREIAKKYHDDDLAVIASGSPKMNIEERWDTEQGTKWVNTSKLPLNDSEGNIVGILGISYDITEKKQKEELIEKLILRLEHEKNDAISNSLIDGLTNIYNRKYLDINVIIELERAKRRKENLSLAMIDIDHFKNYNDRYGHLQGDECLRRVSSILKGSLLRATDVVARYGGEEFCLLLPDTNRDGLAAVLGRIFEKFKEAGIEHEDSGVARFLTVSIGAVSLIPDADTTTNDLIAKADEELYFVKHNGRNGWKIHDRDSAGGDAHAGFMRIQWEPRFCCGNRTIDYQHHKLVEKANDLIRLFGDSSEMAEVKRVIDQLVSDLERHFTDEEKILADRMYPALDEHGRLHRQIMEKVGEMKVDTRNGIQDLLKYLVFDVVLDHMEMEDVKFFGYMTDTP